MVDRIIETLVVQSPGAVGVIIVVVLFLRYLQGSEKDRSKTLHEIGAECHEVQKRSIESLDRNTEMLGRTSQVLKNVEDELRRRD